MKKFLLFYWFNMALFFALFYWDISPIAQFINTTQTDFVAYITSLILDKNIMNTHEIIINKHYSLVIENACNGIIPYLFFLASMVAFPANIWHKIIWAIIGYIVISSINIFRIWLITQFVLSSQDNFSLAHNWIGNILLVVTALTLFVAFVKTKK